MNMIPFFIIVPLAGAFLIPLLTIPFGSYRRVYIQDIIANMVALTLLILSILVMGKNGTYQMGSWVAPLGISLVLDGFSYLMLLIISLIGFMVTIYSIDYMEQYTSKIRYYSLLLLMIAGMNGVVLTGDLFNLFIFLEVASFASYALIGFGCDHEELEAAFKYLVLGSVASAFTLLGIAIIYGSLGTVNMAQIAQLVQLQGITPPIKFAVILFLMGFGLKAAIVPFHAWLPDAYPSAPAPVCAMSSGVLIKALGVYSLIRIVFNVFGLAQSFSQVLMIMGAVSLLVGVLLAVGQWDLKRLLAYHSVSQIGYVILGIGLGTPLGILGGLFHLVNHAAFKSLLFLNAGAINYSAGTHQLKEMGGLREKMPVTATTSLIASMSISGVPPLNGFWSKLIIIVACIQAGHYIFAGIAVIGSILTLASFLKLQKYAFFEKLKFTLQEVKEAPKFMCIAMICLALLCIVMGLLIYPDLNNTYLFKPAVDVLLQGTGYAAKLLG